MQKLMQPCLDLRARASCTYCIMSLQRCERALQGEDLPSSSSSYHGRIWCSLPRALQDHHLQMLISMLGQPAQLQLVAREGGSACMS